MELTTLNTEAIGLVNSGRYIITQLNKDWHTLLENHDNWLYFVKAPHGEKDFRFSFVDNLMFKDIDMYLDDPDFMLIKITEIRGEKHHEPPCF